MIYTCYDMIRDCRADRAEGWRYFISSYVPVIQKLAAHYYPETAGDGDRLGAVLLALRRPESNLFAAVQPEPERWFVAELRQRALAQFDESLSAGEGEPAGEVDLDTMTKALEPLTRLEKQATWLETMRYTPERAGVLLRMDPRTVEKIRGQASDRLRSQMDHWSRSLLADHGRPLGQAAAKAQTPDCVPAKAFLDVLDGRTAWFGREALERHATGCWHCIDHFCRLAEVLELLRGVKPLPEAEAEPLRRLLRVSDGPSRGWLSRLRGR